MVQPKKRTVLLALCTLMFISIIWNLPAPVKYMNGGNGKSIAKEDVSLADRETQEQIREMARSSWHQYYTHCHKVNGNELQPVTNTCMTESDNIVGAGHQLTAIDALDTLYLMGLRKEFNEARDMVERNFRLKKGIEVSVFEVTIRLLGGFLGAFSLTQDPLFKEKAREVGEGLMGAFTGRIATGRVRLFQNETAAVGGGLAEAGSLYLEFMYLSEITGDSKFANAAIRNQEMLLTAPSKHGVFPNHFQINNDFSITSSGHAWNVAGEADSFYEYLVKRCLFDKIETDQCKRSFTQSLDGIIQNLSVSVGEYGKCLVNLGSTTCESAHLGCFAGGMYALAYLQNRSRSDWLEFGSEVTTACYATYQHSRTGLGPENFRFDAITQRMYSTEDKYILRPELVESLYYLYYVKRDEKYRVWGRRIISSLQNHTFVSGGYSGINNMQSKPSFDNIQWSFFLAETLKYLYLLFSDPSDLQLSDWLFNTEAHLIPTRTNRFRAKLMTV